MRLFNYLFILAGVLTNTIANGQIQPAPENTPETYFPEKTIAVKLGDIKALRDITPHQDPYLPSGVKTWTKSNYFKSNDLKNPDALPKNGDPLAAAAAAKKNYPEEVLAAELIPGLNFAGLNDLSGVTPPDPVGDVGLNHYVQMVNSSSGAWFQVWNKQGQSVYGPANTSTIWSQVQSGSIGDPIIQYDHDAQRWLMMEMKGFGENALLIAISDDSDPTGGWKAYSIQCQGFPDYPKLYVWNNAYFVTANEIVNNNNRCSGYALDRQALLSGASQISTYRFELPNFMAIRYQPATGADWEGGPPPPPGSPGLIFRLYDDAWDGGNDQIQIWQIFVDWTTPANNYALGPTGFNVTPFETRVCFGSGLFNCIEQPGFPSTPRITALENIIMYRAPYRNFGSYESIVLNHVTDISGEVGDGGDAGVRWYEFRKYSGQNNWVVYQEGTYAPDMNNRFTGTISQDEQGSICLGYTTASIITNPGIRVTGRRISDPPGEMPLTEYTLIPGGQPHMGDSRWGDYSNMSVDPVDGKTFWYVSEYQPVGQPWGTRIGTFQIRRDSFDITPTVITAPVNASDLTNKQVTVEILNGGLVPASDITADLYVDGVLSTTEAIPGTIDLNGTVAHTFQPLLTWNNIGDKKQLMVITHWVKDEFYRNDTLRTTVKKLASFDASITGTSGLPNQICLADHTFGMIIRNAAGQPLDSARINWNINGGPAHIIYWSGHLLPGEQDTVPVTLSGLANGQNLLKARTLLPNGQLDQDTVNDFISKKIFTNLQGAFLLADAKTDVGIMSYEIRDANNSLLIQGAFMPGDQILEICSSNSTCYKFIYKSTTFRWEGEFKLYDLFGNLLLSIYEAVPQSKTISFCTPSRKQVDVGAVGLLAPATGPVLTANEPVSIAIRNFGMTSQSGITVQWREEGGNWLTETMAANILAAATVSYTFTGQGVDMSTPGSSKNIEVLATVTGDEKPENDSQIFTLTHKVQRDLALIATEALACYDPAKNSVLINVKNTGLTQIDSFEVSYILNGVPGIYKFENLFLTSGESKDQIFQIENGVPGNNELAIDITSVNGAGNDEYEANDSRTINYNIDPNKIAIDLFMGLDDYPRETSWELRYANGTLLAAGDNYTEKGSSIYQRFCVDKDDCFTFKLFDSAGNGMEGSVVIQEVNSNVPIWSFYGVTDTFSNQIAAPFCAFGLCSGFSAAFTVNNASNNTAADGSITVTPSGGSAPFRYSINNGSPQANNTFNNLAVGEYVILVLDNNDCEFTQIVTVNSATSVIDQKPLLPLTVTPNPTRNLVWVRMPSVSSEQYADAFVYDGSGKVIRQFHLSKFDNEMTGSCSLEKCPAGSYFIVVRQKNGTPLAEKRIQKIN